MANRTIGEIVGKTDNCVDCPKRAYSWCGHVTRLDGTAVLAGWCEDHRRITHGRNGCVGEWSPKMGLIPSRKEEEDGS